jgi:hypothetical protein
VFRAFAAVSPGAGQGPGQLRAGTEPYVSLAKFDALHGVRRVGARHYRVTGTYAQVGSFLA